jgi:uncharacterized CHY-type Zn-finger protein
MSYFKRAELSERTGQIVLCGVCQKEITLGNVEEIDSKYNG